MPAPQKPQRTSCDALTRHLRSIGRIPLLTADEEISLARRVQALHKLEEICQELTLRSGGEAPSMETWAAEAGLSPHALSKRLRGGQRAKNRMVSANLRLVVTIARKYASRQFELEDAIQEGNLGLIKAVDRFDPSRGYKFSTYAYWWIREGINRAIADKSRVVRIPIHVGEILSKLRRAQQQLWQQLGRTPSVAELADNTGLKPLDIREALFRSQQPVSLDSTPGEDSDFSLSDLIACGATPPTEELARQHLAQDLERLLEELPSQEAEFIRLRYGIQQETPMTVSAVARSMGVTRDSIRGIERRATASIRERRDKMIVYLEA